MRDKIYHIFAGVAVAALVAMPVYLETLNLFAGIWAAVSAAVVAGGVKEFTDNMHGCKFDFVDWGCTALGSLVVVLFIIGMHIGEG